MAAEALLSSLASTVFENLTALAGEELGLIAGLKTELEGLRSTLSTVQAVIHDAEEQQWKDEAIKNWVKKLKAAAFDAEDVLDEFAIETQRSRRRRGFKNRVRSCLSLDQKPLVFRVKMAHRVKQVRERFGDIAAERDKFHLKERVDGVRVDDLQWRETSSLVTESEIYGRDREKEELTRGLLTGSADLSVHAICGMGGLGKTKLAQLVYNMKDMDKHFAVRIWICVSVDFEIRRVVRAMLESIEQSPCTIQELDNLLQQLRRKLRGRKFLLVLDDIWEFDFDKWSRLNDVLRLGAEGSVVMITTRVQTVALQMATAPVHQIGRLSDEDSWSLFERHAFGIQKREEYMHLEAIGKEIAEKCGGVPLLIKALGSVMRLKRDEDEWLSIKEKMVGNLLGEESIVWKVLRLSYDHLPPHIRQCFAFCSIFPKDHAMRKDQLIQLWMANGFIPCKNQMDLHDMGNEIFNELVWRSIFQDVEEQRPGIITCKMHDLMHDLAQSVTDHECHFVLPNQGRQEIPEKVHHLAVYEGIQRMVEEVPEKDKLTLFKDALQGTASWDTNFLKDLSLRSFLMHSEWHNDPSPYIFQQKRLRAVLCAVRFVPTSISKLKHLRHLDFSNSPIKTLPESICSLHNLQTLLLNNCRKLRMLPKGMKDMENLMYLEIANCSSLCSMPAGMGGLTGLRKLSMFIVGKEDGHGIEELRVLNLEGELSIKDLQNVKYSANARSANLMLKKNLLSLQLFWGKDSSINLQENAEDVLNGLQPHANLKKMAVGEYKGSKFPNWIMDMLLPNLVEIALENCDKCEHLPPFGKLQFLKELQLVGMNAVKNVDNDLYGDGDVSFPSLQKLRVDSMSGLEKWVMPTGRNIFPCLSGLFVSDCPKLEELPLIPTVKVLGIGPSSDTLLKSIMHYTCVPSLFIAGFPDMTVFPDGLMQNYTMLEGLRIDRMWSLQSLSNQLDNLHGLKSLEIEGCHELVSLPDGLRNLSSLETLNISWCHGLLSLPTLGFSGLSSLRNLSIDCCDGLTSLSDGFQYLTGLWDLSVTSCHVLNALPGSIRYLTALQSLTIIDAPGLSSLPDEMGSLTSLSRLELRWCPKLKSLPEGLQNLMELKELTIQKCPHLERSCKKGGRDWKKIAHIPNINYIHNNHLRSVMDLA
ncbi:hypothetical protein Tsubulata_003952 [Turnera subulata]|uniref:Disease resistance protein RGA3 n=1 Tax=Turnera subulata TaxID=218843 RepID=A0A9Q0JMT4_9ROSI|nr:hypothetical protein Tsubulata_003952 [Turnera subulata]